MTAETEVSTPVETVEDTSVTVEPDGVNTVSDTSMTEPEAGTTTAETGNDEGTNNGDNTVEEILYAGKYKSVEELEKGYNEAQKVVAKASEFEKKYNELLEKQTLEAQQLQQEALRQAQMRGFESVEREQIANNVLSAEAEYYALNLNRVDPQNLEYAQANLAQYYQTGHPAYLNEAKKCFPGEFIEHTTIEKSKYEAKLLSEYEAQRAQALNTSTQKLADSLKTDFAEFLSDIKTNEGKAKALKSFCDVGSINSKEDMQVFNDIYQQIADYERAQAIKEYEAQKVINETKQKAVVESTGVITNDPQGLKQNYSQKDIKNMTQKEFDRLYSKYGLDFVSRIEG